MLKEFQGVAVISDQGNSAVLLDKWHNGPHTTATAILPPMLAEGLEFGQHVSGLYETMVKGKRGAQVIGLYVGQP